jgi:hypothetical protein
MPGRKLTVIVCALFLSVALFADGIQCPETKTIIRHCPSMGAKPEQPWVSNQSNLFMATQFIGNAEPKTSTGTNEPFLWGLLGFGLTVVPGVVGLGIGGHGGQEYERVPKALDYGTIGSLIGAGISLTSSVIFSFSQGHDVFTPTFYGTLVGLGTVTIVALAMYPEIPNAIIGAIIVLPIIYFFNHL